VYTVDRMAIQGYTKLFSSIVTSTIWSESNETRLVWITMLALSDKDGYVAASVPGLANLTRITIEGCEAALHVLLNPDKYSRSKEFDGRRIEEVDGGWRLLNHGKYRKLLSAEERREYLATKQREYRSRVNNSSTNVTYVSDTDTRLTHTDSDTKADTEEAVAATAFSVLGFDKPFGQKKFQAIWLDEFARNAEWLTMKMEATIQRCQRCKVGVPPQFFEAKRDVEAREKAEMNRKTHRPPL